jgi:serine/threonine-protein kinase
MAEVYLCRLGGMGGFAKEVVVKRMLPERLSDPNFLPMFLDEARLAANLNHPNVVQVFEIDEIDRVPYIAMEYVRGPTFATVIREAGQAKQLHLGHMAKIVAGVCDGLHHAHTAVGQGGESLGLVHRDVSPQNVLITPEGVPKIFDFGVAKAKGRLATTEAGTLKGKLRYMAPEQLQNGPIDMRADVFSAGVCLFEATTGQSPFGPAEASELQLFRSILGGSYTRPSELRPDYDPLLEQLVLWAIHPDPNQRCPSAAHLRDALEEFVASTPHASSARGVAAFIHELVPPHMFSVPMPDESLRPRWWAGGATPPVTMPMGSPPALEEPPSPARPLAAATSAGVVIPPSPAPPRWTWGKRLVVFTALALAGGAVAGILHISGRPVVEHAPAPAPDPGLTTVVPVPAPEEVPVAPAASPPPEARAIARTHKTTTRPRPRKTGPARDEAEPEAKPPTSLPTPAVALPAPPPPARTAALEQAEPAPTDRPVAPAPPVAKPPTPVPTPAAPIAAVTPAAPTTVGNESVLSKSPRSMIPAPHLPRLHQAGDAAELARACSLIEQEVITRAGVSAEYARGITASLRQALADEYPVEIYPVGMYYFIITEAARGHTKGAAAANLTANHKSGRVRKLNALPNQERTL